MAGGQVRATSFGQIAESYNRVRPGPAQAALDWLVPRPCEVVVDLAAGTGLFTRALATRTAQVIAVEPDDRMRSVLAANSPGVRVMAGWGEAIPLPDASADGLFASSAWHWFDPPRAVPEIARVLRDGARLGVLWTTRDRDVDWVAALRKNRLPGDDGSETAAAGTIADVRREERRHHAVELPAGSPFENIERASFRFTRTMNVDDAVQWLATNSGVITAPEEQRSARLTQARAALLERADAAGMIDFPMRSWCWRADRTPR